MIGTYASYRNTVNNMTRTLNSIMTQPQVQRETEYYTRHIRQVASVDEFLKDERLYSYAMKAWGLEDMTFAKGMMRKVLTDTQFAAGLMDKRYQTFAKAFDFVKYGSDATEQDSATRATVNKYMQQTLEVQAGDSNEGTRLALYFTRTVGDITGDGSLSKEEWAYQMIADKALRQVVFTALGIPDTVAASDVDAQKRMIESHMSYEDLADPARFEQFIARFSAMYDVQNRPPVSAALNVLQDSQSGAVGISDNTMLAMQSLKFGA